MLSTLLGLLFDLLSFISKKSKFFSSESLSLHWIFHLHSGLTSLINLSIYLNHQLDFWHFCPTSQPFQYIFIQLWRVTNIWKGDIDLLFPIFVFIHWDLHIFWDGYLFQFHMEGGGLLSEQPSLQVSIPTTIQ